MHSPLNGAIECDCWFQIFLLFHPADGMMILNDFKCPLTLANPLSPCLASEVLGSGLPADRLLAGRVGWWRGRTWMPHMGLRQVQMEDIAIGNQQQKLCSDCQVWVRSRSASRIFWIQACRPFEIILARQSRLAALISCLPELVGGKICRKPNM